MIPALDIEPWGDPTGYFASFGITFPSSRPTSRRPTKADLDAALSELPHHQFEATPTERGLDYDVTGVDGPQSWGVIWLRGYEGDDSAPVELYFQRGDPDLVLDVTTRLARRCGPILVVLNNEQPHLVGI